MLNLLQPDTTYQVSAYVRLADGEPDSQILLTMQRTPTNGDTAYEWIAPSDADGWPVPASMMRPTMRPVVCAPTGVANSDAASTPESMERYFRVD
jgi:hypothetical protein